MRLRIENQHWVGEIVVRSYGPIGHAFWQEISIELWPLGFTKRIELTEIGPDFQMAGHDEFGNPWGPFRVEGDISRLEFPTLVRNTGLMAIGQKTAWDNAGNAILLEIGKKTCVARKVGDSIQIPNLVVGLILPICGTCALVALATMFSLHLLRRWMDASSSELCAACSYDLRGSGRGAGCPECGWSRPEGEGKSGDKE